MIFHLTQKDNRRYQSNMSVAVDLNQVRATVTEGTLENVRHRQILLHSLHAALRENTDSIIAAIQQDLNGSDDQRKAEAEAEFYLTMRIVQGFYNSLEFEKSIKQEYLLSASLDNIDRRSGFGLVAIRPATHTRFNCIISPLAAAISAGNCICLVVTLRPSTYGCFLGLGSRSLALQYSVVCR